MKHATLLFLCGLIFVAARFVAGTLEDVGTTLDEVKKQTIVQLAEDHFSTYYTSSIHDACKKLPLGVREATMLNVGKTIRDYVESPQFKTDYEKYLKETYTGSSFDPSEQRWAEMKQQKLEEFNRSLKSDNAQIVELYASTLEMDIQSKSSMMEMAKNPDMKALLASLPYSVDDMNKDIAEDKVLKDLFKKDLPAFKKQYAEIFSTRTVRDAINSEKRSAAQDTEKATQEFANRQDYQARLRLQLKEFLDASSNIDFAAVTKANSDNQQIFVNPDYENKDGQWKFYYRCGKEAVGGARKFAQSWLTSLH